MTIALLNNNLREIYNAAHDKNVEKMQLVSDFSGTRVYHASSGWGRLWKWFFNAVDFVFGTDLKLKKLNMAMKKTQKIFQEHLVNTRTHLKTYRSYLEKKSIGISLNEKKYHMARRKITSWNRATAPFIQAFLYESNEKVSKVTARFFSGAFFDDNSSDLQSLSTLQHLIDLEGYLHKPLPLELFVKLACGKKPKDKDLKNIGEWIRQHNKKKSPLSIRPFHLALKSLFVDMKKYEFFKNQLTTTPGKNSDLVRIEMALSELGLKIFTQKDPVHIKWRSGLKPGSVLQYSGEAITLGEQLGKKDSKKDNNLIFSIQGDPDKVIVIGINQAILELKKKVDEEDSWCLHSAECIGIASSGDFAIYERLQGSLENHTWVTNKGWVDHQDSDILTPIQNMLKWMIKQDLTPQRLNLKFLRFDKKGRLKYGKVFLPRGFDYTALEDFVFQCSKGNKTIFSYLMDHSGLYFHPYRTFYNKMLQNALDDKETNTANIAAFEKVSDPRVEDKGELLYQQVVEMKENCLKNILIDYVVPDVDKLEKTIRKELLYYYNSNKLSGTLWPDMEQEITSKIIEKEKLQFRDDR